MTLIDRYRDLGTPAPDRAERTPAEATVELTIDGKVIAVTEGTSVMRAAICSRAVGGSTEKIGERARSSWSADMAWGPSVGSVRFAAPRSFGSTTNP